MFKKICINLYKIARKINKIATIMNDISVLGSKDTKKVKKRLINKCIYKTANKTAKNISKNIK